MFTVQPNIRFYNNSYTIVCTQPDLDAWNSYGSTLQEERYGHNSWVSQAGLVLMGGRTKTGGRTSETVNGGMNFTLVSYTQ